MGRFKKSLLAIIAGSSLLLGSCKEDNPGCPCDAILRTRDSFGIGGYDVGMDDNHYPVKHCGFEYVDGHDGGWGNTLEEKGCGIYFFWAWGSLFNVEVSQGWNGATDTGLKIGDNMEKFFEIYPDARLNMLSGGKNWIAPHFIVNSDENGLIESMSVDIDDFKRYLAEDSASHTCPNSAILYTHEKSKKDEEYNPYKVLGIGDFKLNHPNSTFPVDKCGFIYHKSPDADGGDLKEICENDGVYMEWFLNYLHFVSVKRGWNGATDNGLRIGDSRDRFLQLYPDARNRKVYSNWDYEIWTNRHLKVSIDHSGNVDMMQLCAWDVNDPALLDDTEFPVHPWQGDF